MLKQKDKKRKMKKRKPRSCEMLLREKSSIYPFCLFIFF